ncbi:TetR/AcrR family transcriptional regulator [Chitinophaga agrisoli]|uniref:TetR/AcrR family transcriptional regulator n=1 Tax=Chitinophaga agrisoli TaxID=2607653 RepID=A0A5B2VX87_9BACT|nr:TetR/AcrR family transcriptional regulator [Chitinophaga agrisoli]KAA2242619.1 TetR/AcrR family transcriptional regulator [Chitinophaga agrisoli]
MRAQKIESGDLDQKLFELFSQLGYDGASMELLAKATGLKKASLYHRFPLGKKQMALRMLEIVAAWIRQHIIAVAKDKDVKPEIRLKKTVAAINKLYNGGANNCLLRTLSVGTDAEDFKGSISNCFHLVTEGFTIIARDLGASPEKARQKAKQVNLLIQGSLVVAGATGETGYFKQSLSKIPSLLAA